MLLIEFASLFVFNIARMSYLISIMYEPYFSTMHWVFENIISAVLIASIWMAVIFILKIRTIPVVSDYLFLKRYFQGRAKAQAKKR